MDNLWAIILAGGESRRMGTPKMLLPFKGSTMLEKVIEIIKDSGIEQIIVVLGAEREKISELLKSSKVRTSYNERYKEGMLSSVICGLQNVPAEAEAVLVFQGDEPLISPTSVKKVVEGFRSSQRGIVIPVYGKKRGHPLLIAPKYMKEVPLIEPERGLRALAEKHFDDVLEVDTDDPGILKDFDTFEEYSKEINQIS
jgi:molybdenum cofactor cytidylyltransferase